MFLFYSDGRYNLIERTGAYTPPSFASSHLILFKKISCFYEIYSFNEKRLLAKEKQYE